MTEDEYIHSVIAKYALSPALRQQVQLVFQDVRSLVKTWAGNRSWQIKYSGSYAKGTAVRGGSDVDIFVSISTSNTLENTYESLAQFLQANSIHPRRQNVSIRVVLRGLQIDLVPARRQAGPFGDHSLYRRRTQSWTKINVDRHIQIVKGSGRLQDIKAIKIWRNIHGLEFPSILLELTVIEALRRTRTPLGRRIVKVFDYLQKDFPNAAVIDPSNSANILSDDLDATEKGAIASRASWSLQQQSWDKVLW